MNVKEERKRLRKLFREVKENALKDEEHEINLRIIGSNNDNSPNPKYTPPGRTTYDYNSGEKIIILNREITRHLSNEAVKGLIAHEIAHFFSRRWKEIARKNPKEKSIIFDQSEREADHWAKSKGFETEVKRAREEISKIIRKKS
ncbi:MAG: hypothetical protein ACOCSA_02680 [Candidatus Hadarchaeota archaeon]